MYHGIIIDQEFTDQLFPNTFKVFAEKKDGSWTIYGVEIEDSKLGKAINDVKNAMKQGNWYAHFYKGGALWVVFKDKTFRVKPDKSTWGPIIEYGQRLKIPEEQLDFQPNRFQDEQHYFSEKYFK
ncbi:hypothetical protein A2473_01375 [candidate division WWE3 bacterium RIFOXYC2_FULL_42_13]|uniref:Uncharacterized protein n=1 Tax=candidate division WWE3 bacterium TaxID=2053526 RepID=A0A3D0ZP24_UNCKA|nr:MAG: hypothetical protein A2245_01640 [candidate division WWE3 bacterium RIFOXYA2_FULL_43_12]OGC73658.1 MAG: hypothetical protein A2473_01375 [candidate division WWE3 bacterium RIFOXYC2_FULL_42_13]OGC74094.1 MAG: hypothetical protein A2337_00020 [candidate division WWE3 bacterium RIFOXYB2_FULL_43_9]OGC75218.1 MAG: hypothetical protein A2547_02290 [candidate division WWE3 bacterium RIFOXYD2_FULL_43_10]HCC42030.1 hypothetical protein [candidate division WWE3 bacterium]HLD90747.1 hypothetical 